MSSLIDRVVGGARDPDEIEARLMLAEQARRDKRFVGYWEPQGDQIKFWEQLRPEQKVWLVLGGNRAGKSDLGCFLITAWLLGKKYFKNEVNWKWIEPLPIPEGPVNVRSVGLNFDLLKDPLWEKLTRSTDHPPFFPEGSIESRSDHQITARFKDGSKYTGKSADVDSRTHGGPSCHLVHLDEECSKAIYDESYQRTVSTGGKLLVTATPLLDIGTSSQPWLYDMVQQWKDGDPEIGVVFLSALNNPFTPEDEKRKLLTKWKGHEEERTRLYGEFLRRSGLYYKRWKSEPPLWVPAHDIPTDYMRVVMIDPAVTGYVGALWAAISPAGKMILYRSYKEKGLTPSQHVERILIENRGDPIRIWACDPFMGKQRVPDAQLKEEYKTVLQVWREAGLPRLIYPDLDYEKTLASSHEYLEAAYDPTNPHPSLEVFDHLSDWEWEISRYVIDSVAQGPNRGDVRDRPRKGRDGSSTLMECYQYLCGMHLRARAFDRPPKPNRPITRTKPWGEEAW